MNFKSIRAPIIRVIGVILLLVNHDLIFKTSPWAIVTMTRLIRISSWGLIQNQKQKHASFDWEIKILQESFLMQSIIVIIFAYYTKGETIQLPRLVLIYQVLFIPIFEEIIFRQVLYHDTHFKQPMVGMLLIRFLFVVYHLPTSPIAWIYYSFSTTVLFYAYHQSQDDARVSILIHFINNLIILVI